MSGGSDRLAGRTVLVVGAGTQPSEEDDAPVGNGRAIAVTAAREGAEVVCVDRVAEAADGDGRRSSAPRAATPRSWSATSPTRRDCTAIVGAAAEAGGRPLHGVVLNVGIGRGGGLAEHVSTPTGTRCSPSTCGATSWSPGRRRRHMPEGGAFVFVSSVAGLQPGSRSPAYDASKAGMHRPQPPRRPRERPPRRAVQRRSPRASSTPRSAATPPRAGRRGGARPCRSAARARAGRWPT